MEKLHFSLNLNFYCCLVKYVWALKVVSQFAIPVLVAYKPIAYKTKCSIFKFGNVARLINTGEAWSRKNNFAFKKVFILNAELVFV